MCGITGTYSYKQAFSREDIQKMTDALSKRGPDAEGIFLEKNVTLGHRRLSIIDLSEAANQPFSSQDGKYTMVFNGEIYNYLEIRSLLPKKTQAQLKTSSDTETIIELFAHLGIEKTLKHLNGMFAIALYDKANDKITLIRDRIGIKPLFYYWDGEKLAFASELKALTKLSIPKNISNEAVAEFLHLGYIPAPHCIYKDYFKLLPGHILELSGNTLSIKPFWEISDHIPKTFVTNENQVKDKLGDLLQSSIEHRLIADVPLGVFLSGGIDSSLVASLAAKVSSKKVKTFSIGFKENKFNEAVYAKQVSDHIGSEHHEFMISTSEAKKLIPELINIYDEPFADSSAVPTLLVSELARKHVTIALGGDGGDELFLGYGMYQWADRLEKPWFKAPRKVISAMLKLKKGMSFQKASSLFDYPNGGMQSHIFSQEQMLFSQKEIKALMTQESTPIQLYDPALSPAAFNQSVFDMKYYLPDDLLVKVDRASMYHSLEARVPLLDHRVVEYALSISPDLKYKNGERKHILKEILYENVPKKIFLRPKQGFSIPLVQWLRDDLKYLIDEYLDEKVIKHYNLVNYEKVVEIKRAYLDGNDYYYNRLWTLIVLHQFLKIHEFSKQ